MPIQVMAAAHTQLQNLHLRAHKEEIRPCLPNYSSRHLANILRQILQQLEEQPDVDPDDPALIQLKIIVLEKIAALEAEHSADPHSADWN